MKLGDVICLIGFAAGGLMLGLPGPHELLRELSLTHRYGLGMAAFAVMGALGQAAAARLSEGRYPRPAALAAAALMWGLFGLARGRVIWLVNGGVVMLQAVGMLPGGSLHLSTNMLAAILGSVFFTQPFFTSVFLNLGAIHPFSALRCLGREAARLALAEGRVPSLSQTAARVDWAGFLRREFWAVPLFRIPLLTAVFMLPHDLWLPTAAFIIALLNVLETLILVRGVSR
ncbi:MAG: hypothetical protein LBV79_08745 [Candidatus Adiutrix sp.]|jgi:hypothetical protein|nr:hypothetical protein [Candidatus Adiutrix sp.]